MTPKALPLALLLALVSATANAQPRDRTFSATLERGPCFGSCPSYRVTVDAGGAVTFTGRAPGRGPLAGCQGVRRWRVSAASVAALRHVVDVSSYFAFKPEYAAAVTDAPSYSVSITWNGHTKTVRDYVGAAAGMPAAMTRIEQAIDTAADTRRCLTSPGR